MSKHTPGPWLYSFESDWTRSGGLWVAKCGKYVIHAQCWDPQETYDSEKTARLIAAAPYLLEALEMLLEFPNTGPATSAARSAIAKVRGEK